MYTKIFIAVGGIAVLALGAYWLDKYSDEASRLRAELTTRSDSLTSAKAENTVLADSLVWARERVKQLGSRIDSLTTENEEAAHRSHEFKVKINRLTMSLDSFKLVASNQNERLTSVVAELEKSLSQTGDTTVALVSTRATLQKTTVRLDRHVAFVQQMRPWYEKWKHDATERNFLEKIFGADKATAPMIPEPNFDTIEFPADTMAESHALTES